MKKKLVFGLSAACIAGAFWACGDGEIINADASLEGLATTLVNEGLGESEIKSALANCVAGAPGYEGCQEEMANPPDIIEMSSETPASSAGQAPGTSASQVPHSSSSILRQTSSTGPIGQLSSSSQAQTPVSQIAESSSSVQPSTGDTNYGTCAPKDSPIDAGGSASWTFTKGSAIQSITDLTNSKYTWTFEGGSPATYEATGSPTPPAIAYATSGVKTATLTVVTPSSGTGVVTCSPLQVNGAKITGCKCAAAAETVDVQEGGVATWSVSGCTTTANITGYTWGGTGVTGVDTSATATLAAKGEKVTPTLQVSNDDNTVINVTCPTVTAMDSDIPDYEIKEAQAQGAIPIPGGKEVTVKISIDCAQNHTFFCNGDGAPTGGTVDGVAGAESWYVTWSLSASACSGTGSVVVELSAPGKCGAY